MIKTFEALVAAIIIVSFLFYLSPVYFHTSKLYNISKISYADYYGCFLSNNKVIGNPTQNRMKLLIVEFNESFKNSCVNITFYANRTYAYSNGFIPSHGGKNITLEIVEYNSGDPIFIYLNNNTQNKFECNFPYKKVGYKYLLSDTDYKEVCGAFEVIR